MKTGGNTMKSVSGFVCAKRNSSQFIQHKQDKGYQRHTRCVDVVVLLSKDDSPLSEAQVFFGDTLRWMLCDIYEVRRLCLCICDGTVHQGRHTITTLETRTWRSSCSCSSLTTCVAILNPKWIFFSPPPPEKTYI
jgi:hypothetical protein